MKAGWEYKTLGEVTEYEKTPNRVKNTIYVGLEDIESNSGVFIGSKVPKKVKSNTFYFNDEHVLYGRLRPYLNKVLIPDFEGHCSTEIFPIKPNQRLNKRFLFHWLLYEDTAKKINSTWTGARMPRANMNAVLNFEIPVPPLSEQKHIVSILDEAFSAIAKAKENAEKNLRNARELFESYLQSVFENPGSDWEEKTLDRIAENLDSKRIPITKNKRKSGPFPYYGASGVVDHVAGYLFDEPLLLISEDGANLLARSTPIAFSVSGKIWVNNHAHILKFENMETQKYVELYFSSIKLDDYITGAAQPKLNQSALNSIVIPIPPIPEIKRINSKIHSISTEMKRLEAIYEKKLVDLEDLKKSILQKAFTGEFVRQDVTELNTISWPIKLPNISTTDLQAGILAMAHEQHEKDGKLINFGHVKAEKIAHMIEARLGISLDRQPFKDAAGPNDFKHLIKVESRAKKANYFNFKRSQGGAYQVSKLGGYSRLITKTRNVLGDRLGEVEKLLQWMLPMTTQQAEIVATVYAAWNNLLLDGKQPTDEEIVREAREDWHPKKLEIDRDKFFSAITWLKKENVVPEGKGTKVLGKTN